MYGPSFLPIPQAMILGKKKVEFMVQNEKVRKEGGWDAQKSLLARSSTIPRTFSSSVCITTEHQIENKNAA